MSMYFEATSTNWSKGVRSPQIFSTDLFAWGMGKDKGKCRDCGADVVDWGRVHARNLADVAKTFSALENETWRAHMMHVNVPAKVQNLALRVPPRSAGYVEVRKTRNCTGRNTHVRARHPGSGSGLTPL